MYTAKKEELWFSRSQQSFPHALRQAGVLKFEESELHTSQNTVNIKGFKLLPLAWKFTTGNSEQLVPSTSAS